MDYGKLKTYYESIDGVTVPFVYPQYWDKDNEEWVVVDKDNRLPVDARVTGSNVEQLIERQVINTSNNNNIRKVPFGAKGFIFQAIIYDVTGTFDDGEGVRLRVFSLARGSYINRASVSDNFTNYTTDVGNLTISTQKEGGMSMSNAIEYKNYDTPILAPYVRFDVNVTGSFSGGEGIDLEVAIMWLY